MGDVGCVVLGLLISVRRGGGFGDLAGFLEVRSTLLRPSLLANVDHPSRVTHPLTP